MDKTDRIRELLRQIRDAEQRLDGLRAELRRLVQEELGRLQGTGPLSDSVLYLKNRVVEVGF